MDTENKNVELDQEQESATELKTNDELKGAIEETLSKIRRQSMLLGAQVMLQTVLDKITAFERKPGSKSNNDHKRLIKDIKQFCEQGLTRKVDANGETSPIENVESETVQD